jgi:hypothetical protein
VEDSEIKFLFIRNGAQQEQEQARLDRMGERGKEKIRQKM